MAIKIDSPNNSTTFENYWNYIAEEVSGTKERTTRRRLTD